MLPIYFLIGRFTCDKTVQAVLNETLRLFPSAPLMARMSKDVELTLPCADGQALYLPPRTQIMMASLLVHRRHDLWGNTADDFNPDRWFDAELVARVAATPFMFFPFFGGPRMVNIYL